MLAAGAYLWANRTGRYQVARPNDAMYVVIDTATRRHWIYRGEVEDGHAVYDINGTNGQASLYRRLILPPGENTVAPAR
jgi:hypothetical protein